MKKRLDIPAIAAGHRGQFGRSEGPARLVMLLQTMTKPAVNGNCVSLRRRENRDAEALFAMFSQPLCRRAMVIEPFASADEVQAWCDSRGPDTFDLVATIDDLVVGFAGLYSCPGSQSHSGWLSLFIHDAFHGRGIGTMMMRAIIATSELLAGLTRLQLIVFCDNERAISLYRKFGFKFEGRHECFARRGEAFVPAFTMARLTTAQFTETLDMEGTREAIRNLLLQFDDRMQNPLSAPA